MSPSRRRYPRARNHGQALAELALALPILLVIGSAAFVAPRLSGKALALTSAARVGAAAAVRDQLNTAPMSAQLADVAHVVAIELGEPSDCQYPATPPAGCSVSIATPNMIGANGTTLVQVTVVEYVQTYMPLIATVAVRVQVAAAL